MAIYDINEGITYEIGHVYDYRKGTLSEIGKIWDRDGGTYYLIHTAEETIYPGYTVTTQKWGTGNAGSFFAQVINANGGAGKAYIAFDVTNWSTVSVTYSAEAQTYTQCFLGLKASLTEESAYLPTQNYSIGTIFWSSVTAMTAGGTINLNVSGYSGVVYLVAHAYSGSTANASATLTVSSVILR